MTSQEKLFLSGYTTKQASKWTGLLRGGRLSEISKNRLWQAATNLLAPAERRQIPQLPSKFVSKKIPDDNNLSLSLFHKLLRASPLADKKWQPLDIADLTPNKKSVSFEASPLGKGVTPRSWAPDLPIASFSPGARLITAPLPKNTIDPNLKEQALAAMRHEIGHDQTLGANINRGASTANSVVKRMNLNNYVEDNWDIAAPVRLYDPQKPDIFDGTRRAINEVTAHWRATLHPTTNRGSAAATKLPTRAFETHYPREFNEYQSYLHDTLRLDPIKHKTLIDRLMAVKSHLLVNYNMR